MSEDGFLNFLALLVAGFGLLAPVRRAVLPNFVPFREAGLTIYFAGACLLLRRLHTAGFLTIPAYVDPVLQMLAWIFPVVWILVVVGRYRRGRILKSTPLSVDKVLREAVLADDYADAARYLMKNRECLVNTEHEDRELLFDPNVVAAFHSRGSEMHLELLRDRKFVASLRRPLEAVDAAVRAQLAVFPSPLRAGVLSEKGGYEGYRASSHEREIFDATIGDPEWSLAVSAHYPLVLVAIETLRSGGFDTQYSIPQPNYVSRQGPSERANCRVFLAEKAMTIIVERAIARGVAGDLYLSNFWQLYEEILGRLARNVSEQTAADSWQLELVPFNFLLDEIEEDLTEFVRRVIQGRIAEGVSGEHAQEVLGEVAIAEDAAKTWMLCCWADSRFRATPLGGRGVRSAQNYLEVAQQLRFDPHAFHLGIQDARTTAPFGNRLLELMREHLLSKGEAARLVVEEAIARFDVARWHSPGQTRDELRGRLGLI